ncbi:MAG: hypothetical protein M5U33_13295 [Pseudorhodoplanes sp.]|nr:hypothetical protein [Pseudorhodoplanes sp.]
MDGKERGFSNFSAACADAPSAVHAAATVVKILPGVIIGSPTQKQV